MAEQSGFDDDRNNPHAQRLIRILEEFARTCEQRAGRDSGKVLDRDRTLDGTILSQKPERFIEEELVEPIASEVLGYDIRFEPKGFDGLEGRIPDFTILNLEAENFGEIKRPRMADVAISESVDYLNMATQRPLVGIATDGFSWILHIAGVGEDPTYQNHERIYVTFKKIRLEARYNKTSRASRPKLRGEASNFVNEFHIDTLRNKIQ